MSVKVKAVTVEDHKVDGSQDTGAAHAIPIETYRVLQP